MAMVPMFPKSMHLGLITRNLLIPRVTLRIAQASRFRCGAMLFEHADSHVLTQDFNGVVKAVPSFSFGRR